VLRASLQAAITVRPAFAAAAASDKTLPATRDFARRMVARQDRIIAYVSQALAHLPENAEEREQVIDEHLDAIMHLTGPSAEEKEDW
jgi:hypothetical protein